MGSFSIIYEDSEIWILNKDAGVSVQGGEGVSHPLDKELALLTNQKVFPVHRLDKETAGLLVVAKTREAASKWTHLFSDGSIKKEYIALCFGFPLIDGKEKEKGVIESKIEKNGKLLSAKTFFRVISSHSIEIPSSFKSEGSSSYEKLDFSLLNLTLGTGRMHQIRIHLSKVNCPIVGDDKHGDFKKNKIARKLGIKKLMLSSFRLEIPLGEKKEVFEIPFPPHIKDASSLIFGLQS